MRPMVFLTWAVAVIGCKPTILHIRLKACGPQLPAQLWDLIVQITRCGSLLCMSAGRGFLRPLPKHYVCRPSPSFVPEMLMVTTKVISGWRLHSPCDWRPHFDMPIVCEKRLGYARQKYVWGAMTHAVLGSKRNSR